MHQRTHVATFPNQTSENNHLAQQIPEQCSMFSHSALLGPAPQIPPVNTAAVCPRLQRAAAAHNPRASCQLMVVVAKINNAVMTLI